MLRNLRNIGAWTVGARLTLIAIVMVGAMLFSLIALINHNISQRTEEQAAADVTDKTKMIVDMLEVFDNELRAEIHVYAKVFARDFKEPIALDSSRSLDVAGTAAPVLKSGAEDLNLDFAIPDRFTEKTGGIATIFVKKEADFVRISTSLKKENGERAIGTMLDHAHPAYQNLIQGKNYVGIATLFGKQYMTEYDLIADSAGKTIGILFVGLDFTESIAQIKDRIRAMKIGETGYYYALDAKEGKNYGTILLHPIKEGQNVLDSKDKNGHEFIKEILERKQGLIRYPWVNAERNETEPREKITAFYPMKNWNWIIAGGIYADEYTQESNKLILRYQLIGVALLIVMGAGLYWAMRVGLSIPLQIATDAAKKLADGDLTTTIKVVRVDEIGQLMDAINGIGHGLAGVVNNVRESTALIVRSAEEISRGNADLSIRTELHANSLEETVTSMHELTSTVKQNSDSAIHANKLVASASNAATKGGQVVSQVTDTMTSIKESSRRIVDIISVIDGIAFQTNILALNAAVEAARAGEQGRGFAVVATEVRNLAQRSASAAKEIKALIGDSVDKVDAGNLLAETTGKTMDEIVNSVGRVAGIISEISSASEKQSSGIGQVDQAVAQMGEMTQQNATLVEQAATAAKSMLEQANTLVQAVSVFKMNTQNVVITAPANVHAGSPRQVPPTGQSRVAASRPVPAKKIARIDTSKTGDWEEF